MLPVIGAASLKTCYAASTILHAVLYWRVACSNPGYITITTAETSELIAQGVKGQLCRETGVMQPVRSRYVTYCNHLIGRFDHYCDWVRSPVSRAHTLPAPK